MEPTNGTSKSSGRGAVRGTPVPAEVRQLEKVLKSTLIPLAQSGAPVLWVGVPPMSSLPLAVKVEETTPLWEVPVTQGFDKSRRWEAKRVNSIEVPIIGCILDGEIEMRVHTPPGEDGRLWRLPIKKNQMFFIPPDTPFSDGSDPSPDEPYTRVILIYLQRDGIRCLRYTADKGKLWRRPYTFLYEPEAFLPRERLLGELQRDGGHTGPIAYHYLSILFHLMLRSIKNARFATLRTPRYKGLGSGENGPPEEHAQGDLVKLAAEFIDFNLENNELNIQQVSAHAGLSVGHMNRQFREARGMTPYQYLQNQRFEKAKHLLMHSNLPIWQVAELSGFREQAHFAHWFARRQGCSPSEFRLRG